MDINVFLRVVRRFKFIVVIGAIVACLLAVLSFTRITTGGLAYRQPTEWGSTQRLYVKEYVPRNAPQTTPSPQELAQIYATYATSDAVTTLTRRYGKPRGKLVGSVAINPDGSASRVVQIDGVATTKLDAKLTALFGSRALGQYVAVTNRETLPRGVKVTLVPVGGGPSAPEVIRKPSVTRPIFVFLAVMTAVFGLIFVLENLRPAVRVESDRDKRDDDVRQMTARRTGGQSG
jgi:hypothetical protein